MASGEARPGRPLREGSVDLRQLRALVGLELRESLRTGVNPNTGSRASPARHLAISMGSMGLLLALNARSFADLASYLIAIFTATSGTVALAVLPDTHQVRERRIELLRSKPVSRLTHAAAHAVALLVVSVLIVSCLAGPGLVAAALRFAAPWWMVLGLYGSVVLASYSCVLLSVALVVKVAARHGVERVRMASQTVLAVILLGLFLVSMAGLSMGLSGIETRISFEGLPSLRLLPPAWFADAWTRGPGLAANLERLAAILLAGGALLTGLRLGETRAWEELAEKLRDGDGRAPAPPASVRLLATLASLPLVGSRLGGRAGGVAAAILTVWGRDEAARVRSVSWVLSLLGCFALGVWFRYTGAAWLGVLASLGLSELFQGLEGLKRSPDPGAAWVFVGTPLRRRDLLRGLVLAVLVRHFALSWLLVTLGLLLSGHPPGPGAPSWPFPVPSLALSLLYLVMGWCMVALDVAVRPALPLGCEASVLPGLGGHLLGILVGILGGVAFSVMVAVVEVLGGWGAVAAGAALLGGGFLAVVLGRIGARRLEGLEAP